LNHNSLLFKIAVFNLIAGRLGLDPAAAGPNKFDQVISQNPETLSKLRQLETRHEAELQKLVIESQRHIGIRAAGNI
jgi:hypothetical protein